MFFGSNLKFLRLVNKESQEDIAKLVNKKRNSISNWETGENVPIVGDIIIICKHYNVDLYDMCETDLAMKYAKDNYPNNEISEEKFISELEHLINNSSISEEKKKYIRKMIKTILEEE